MWFTIDTKLKYIHLNNGCIDSENRGRALSILSRLPLIVLGCRNPKIIELIGSFTLPKLNSSPAIYVSRSLLQKHFGFYTLCPKKKIKPSSGAGGGGGAGGGAGVEQESEEVISIPVVTKDSVFINLQIPQNKKYSSSIKKYILSHNNFDIFNRFKYFSNTFLLIKGMDKQYIINALTQIEKCERPKPYKPTK